MMQWIFAFPTMMVLFCLFIALFVVVFWVWAFIDCLRSKRDPAEKLLWIVIILFFPLIGALLYLLVGTRGGTKMTKHKGKKLVRSKRNRLLGGVCAGVGKYLGIDPTVVRLVWVLLSLASLGTGVLIYLIAWILIPEE
jgi:phage shock protein PspC (stress-responsive transcriptional regulator)